jgi:hypothetical protein
MQGASALTVRTKTGVYGKCPISSEMTFVDPDAQLYEAGQDLLETASSLTGYSRLLHKLLELTIFTLFGCFPL